MKIYIAPLEGITGYIFRNAFNKVYGNADKYFAPFITPSEKCAVTPRDKKELAPENNRGMYLVPQILTCRSDGFINAMKELKEMGYKEVNLNLGCPSGTVCAKGKGAGFLPETTALSKFLDEIYSAAATESMKISIKTRLGYYNPEEFYDLAEIFNAFPVSELIVHPRIRGDFYKGEPRKEYFA
ncbi:MAG: tRNA-dihydrouridine synthase family protein, partial [Clostridiales bacterium]|nr:tRNA-dihydrouridine synthase family protein [Clostridiales bacterium]